MANRYVKLLAVVAIAGGCEKDKRVPPKPPAAPARPGLTVMQPRVLRSGAPAPGNVATRGTVRERR